ncbi:WXG100 family type VII secretion target [Streptomyces sp. NPDC060184]|uniref:WXG100 family type VII secretion target n=1 Tax=Streptomyces sp. NPDC060184 TaxID=3347064 RepID=UPI0036641498
MTDENQPELTPAEQQKYDQGRVKAQIVGTDITERVREVAGSFFGGSGLPAGRTSFEHRDLNAMIDLVEHSNPADLEAAGQELYKARDAIREAAKELGDHIAAVDWKGEANIAFRDWGAGLVAHATRLGDFADSAATQITVAGTGLASVKSSLPPRDTRAVRTDVKDIPAPERLDSNPEYAAAVRVEDHRQEAINQANRLASYYSVSSEVLATQEAPRFDMQLSVDMPRPTGERKDPASSSGSSGHTGGSLTGHTAGTDTVRSVTGEVNSPQAHHTAELGTSTKPVLDSGTRTEIDSVSAPPAPPTTLPGPSPVSPATGGTQGPGTTTFPPTGPLGPNGVTGGSKSVTGTTGGPKGSARTGGLTGGTTSATQRTATGNAGRSGGSQGFGRTTGTGGGTSSATGRSGVTGGRAVAGGSGSGTGSAPRAGRGGITGGTPQQKTSGTGTSGARTGGRGTVIGGQKAGQSGASARSTGQRGVVGNGGSAARPTGRGTPGQNGVVGTPRGRSGGKGFTSGGAGLVRPGGRQEHEEEEENNTSTRPDYLTEDEETWTAGRPEAAPPVIE